MTILFRMIVTVVWLMAVAMILVKTSRSSATLYRIQSIAEAAIAAALAVTGDPWLWISVGLVLAIKTFFIPFLINHGSRPFAPHYSAKGPLGMASLLVIIAILTAGGLLLIRIGKIPHPTLTGLIFAALFVAFLHLSARYEIWSLMWALLSLDTVVGVGALIFGRGLPEVADVGINLASLALALVLTYLAVRIERIKHSLDTRTLEELIG